MTEDRADIIRRLEGAQQEHFKETLRRSDRKNLRHIGEAWAAGQAPAHTPKFVTVHQSGGKTETYIVSAKSSRGKYGRFRRALRSDGVMVGVKDFRLPERFERDLQRRITRIEALVQSGVITAQAARQLAFSEAKLVELVRLRKLTLMNVAAVAKNRAVVIQWVAQGQLTAEEGTELMFDRTYFEGLKGARTISPEVAAKIDMTHFSTREAIDAEYNTLRVAGSPLAEMGRFNISDRLFVLTQPMDIDALALARLPMSDPARASVTRHVLAGLARSLARFHKAGVVHRDVKLENALIDASGAVEVADVGLATQLNSEGLATHAVGTLQYAAPEMVAYQLDLNLASCPAGKPYTQVVDVFSLGIAAASMAVRRNLIHGDGADALSALKDFAQIREACPRHPDTGLCDLDVLLSERSVPSVRSTSADHVRHVLAQWHANDPKTATYVFTHMLAVDPCERASMHDVQAWFDMQIEQACADALTTCNLVHAHVEQDGEDERAMMRAFAGALSK
jgi:serine/threonine protein kinase